MKYEEELYISFTTNPMTITDVMGYIEHTEGIMQLAEIHFISSSSRSPLLRKKNMYNNPTDMVKTNIALDKRNHTPNQKSNNILQVKGI